MYRDVHLSLATRTDENRNCRMWVGGWLGGRGEGGGEGGGGGVRTVF